jgi:hypothetical protein
VIARIQDRGRDPIRSGGDERIVGPGDETVGDDLRSPNEVAALLVDRYDDQEHAVRGEHAAVAQDDVADLTDRQSVDVDVAGFNGCPPA